MKLIPYGRQHITESDVAAVTRALLSDYLTQGPQIEEFEKAFAQYVGSRYAIAVSNGTAALHLCALALDVTVGHSVITTPITFAASANCVRYCNGDVIFADIDSKTALIDLDHVRRILENSPTGKIRGIIPVDFAGHPVNMQEVRSIADEFDLWIIEDACHAPGGAFFDTDAEQWHRCGNGQYADLAIFSFHPVKHIACGEGGMITTNRQDLYERLVKLRTHGITKDPNQMLEYHGGWYYEMQELGYNYRLSDIQAALGLSQLKRADEGLLRRQKIAKQYNEAFAGTNVIPLKQEPDTIHAYHLYVVKIADRRRIYEELKSIGIAAQVHYIPVHKLPYYQKNGFANVELPNAEAYYEECLSLPMYPTLTDAEQEYVIKNMLRLVSVPEPA